MGENRVRTRGTKKYILNDPPLSRAKPITLYSPCEILFTFAKTGRTDYEVSKQRYSARKINKRSPSNVRRTLVSILRRFISSTVTVEETSLVIRPRDLSFIRCWSNKASCRFTKRTIADIGGYFFRLKGKK